MNEINSKEWWLWHINRRVAEFIHQPDSRSESALLASLREYRKYRQHTECGTYDEHEWAMDYR